MGDVRSITVSTIESRCLFGGRFQVTMEVFEGFDGALMKISIPCSARLSVRTADSVLNPPFPVATGDYLILYHAAHPPVGRFDWNDQNRALTEPSQSAGEYNHGGARATVMTGH